MGRRKINASPTSPFGELLRQRRTELGLTLREAHEATGISTSYISRIETGQIRRPSPDIIIGLVNAHLLPEDFAQKLLDIPTLTTADREAIRQIVREELESLHVGPAKPKNEGPTRSSIPSTSEGDNIIRIAKPDNLFKEPIKFPINRIEFIEDPNPRRRA